MSSYIGNTSANNWLFFLFFALLYTYTLCKIVYLSAHSRTFTEHSLLLWSILISFFFLSIKKVSILMLENNGFASKMNHETIEHVKMKENHWKYLNLLHKFILHRHTKLLQKVSYKNERKILKIIEKWIKILIYLQFNILLGIFTYNSLKIK